MHQAKSKFQGKILMLQWGRGLRVSSKVTPDYDQYITENV